MEKSIGLKLSKFPKIPPKLREVGAINVALSEIKVPLAGLYHHYYLEAHGRVPPNPDPAQFEHLEFLLPCADFRIRGDGIGNALTIRRHRSNEFGQSFCRWFLHDNLNITYFANMEHVLGQGALKKFGDVSVERTMPGDTPDYLCAEDENKIYLAEAKGSHAAVSFSNKKFDTWRKQFDRVLVRDSSGHARSVKGFIVATRFGTEVKPSVKSQLFAEDPQSPGEHALGDGGYELGQFVIASHYSNIALKMGQGILSAALATRSFIPNEINYPATVWELMVGPLQGKRFVGGYYPSAEGALPVRIENGKIIFPRHDPLRLDVGTGTFFGLEETIFRQVCALTRPLAPPTQGLRATTHRVDRFEAIDPFYSAVSILRDGSILGPVEFFNPVEPGVF